MLAKGYYEELTGKSEDPAKIKAVKFELTRAEGPTALCGKAQPVTTWKEADNILREWALTAPASGGYDKCDFTVHYADGETYSGRYDLKAHDVQFPELLAYHIRGYVEFHTGEHCPEHMTQESYDGYMAACGEDTAKTYQDFLDNYEIGGEMPSPDTLPPYEPPAPPEPQRPNYMKTEAADLPDGTPKIVTHVDFMGETYHVDIWPKQAIRLTGSYKNHVNGPVPFDITFKIGDRAEYDSYNLSYVGDIVSIGPKTVTIKHDGYSDRKSRLDMKHFAWRNWDFDAERIAKEHANWYD